MPRTAMCRVCAAFVQAEDTAGLLTALRDHALEQLPTHHMAEVGAVDLDGCFEGIMRHNRPWTRQLVT